MLSPFIFHTFDLNDHAISIRDANLKKELIKFNISFGKILEEISEQETTIKTQTKKNNKKEKKRKLSSFQNENEGQNKEKDVNTFLERNQNIIKEDEEEDNNKKKLKSLLVGFDQDDVKFAILPRPMKDNENLSTGVGAVISEEELETSTQNEFHVGLLVEVIPEPRGKMDAGGVGRIVQIHESENGSLLYDVRFIVKRGTAKRLPRSRLKPSKMNDLFFVKQSSDDPLVHAGITSLAEKNPSVSIETPLITESPVDATTTTIELKHEKMKTNTNAWVRRSERLVGAEQFQSSDVKQLLDRLKYNDPGLEILRLKNWLVADTNSLVMEEVFNLLERNTVVQVLYVQQFNDAMDDTRLYHLIKVLKNNPRIWALNIGENFKITRDGWEKFAEELPATHLTHLYAGSESTVYGPLKIKMRDAIRDNRKKHDLHCSPANFGIIAQVGQMWWNPRNAKCLSHLSNTIENALVSSGFTSKAESNGSILGLNIYRRGKLGRIAKVIGDSRLVVYFPSHYTLLNATIGTNFLDENHLEKEWIDVTKDHFWLGRRLAFAQLPNSQIDWPCQVFIPLNSHDSVRLDEEFVFWFLGLHEQKEQNDKGWVKIQHIHSIMPPSKSNLFDNSTWKQAMDAYDAEFSWRQQRMCSQD